MHCWEVLADSPKWIERVKEEEEKTRSKAASKSVQDEDSVGSVEQPASGSRPLGCKASKKQMKRKSSTVDDRLEEMNKRQTKLEEDRRAVLKLMRDVLEHQKKALDVEVMSKDLCKYVDDPEAYSFFKQVKEETMIRHRQRIEEAAKPKEVIVVEDEEPTEDAVAEVRMTEEVVEVEIAVVKEVETEDIKPNK